MTQLSDIATLCTTCNMCCNGMLFAHVNVTQAEIAKLGGDVPYTQDKDGGCQMLQPCTKLGADGACGCYALRPQGCIDYNCDLVGALERGQYDLPFALDVVAQAKTFQRTVINACLKALPPDPARKSPADAIDAFRLLVQAHDAGTPLRPARADEAVLHWVICRTYIQKHIQSDYGAQERLPSGTAG